MKAIYHKSKLNTTAAFEGESLEEKCRRVTQSNAPIEAVSPMYYNERKDGVQDATNIRTDKWDVALNAMDSIAMGTRKKREEKIQESVAEKLKSEQAKSEQAKPE